MNVPEVLTDYISREVVAKTGQPMPTLDQPLLDSEGGVIDSMSHVAVDRFRRIALRCQG